MVRYHCSCNALFVCALAAAALPPAARLHGDDQSVLTTPVGSVDLNRRIEALALRLSATEPSRIIGSGQYTWQSVRHLHRLGIPEIDELKRHMQAAAADFIGLPALAPGGGAPAGTSGAPELEVLDVWLNVVDAGGETGWHTHNHNPGPALKGQTAMPIVGVYYAAVGNSGPSRLLFRPRRSQRVANHVTPERGLAAFLPAHVRHAVEPHRNLTDAPPGPRISVTFNLVPRWFSSEAQRAAYHGNLDEMKRMVQTEEEANGKDMSRDGRSRPLLMTAVEGGHAPVAAHLLGLRADVQARYDARYGGQAGVLHGVSAPAGDTSGLAAVLLAARADLSARAADGSGPLHHAAERGSTALVELMLREGAHADHPGVTGEQQPLHGAAAGGRARIAALLLEHRAAPGAVDSRGQTPLHVAAEQGHREIVKLFVGRDGGLPWEPVTNRKAPNAGDLPAHLAASRGYIGVLEELGEVPGMLSARGANDNTLLHVTTRRPRLQAMAWLLQRRAELFARDGSGMEPLHLAVGYGHTEAARLLLDAGADPCGATGNGVPAPDLAANLTELAVVLGKSIRDPALRATAGVSAELLRVRCDAQKRSNPAHASPVLRGAYAKSTPPCTAAEIELDHGLVV